MPLTAASSATFFERSSPRVGADAQASERRQQHLDGVGDGARLGDAPRLAGAAGGEALAQQAAVAVAVVQLVVCFARTSSEDRTNRTGFRRSKPFGLSPRISC